MERRHVLMLVVGGILVLLAVLLVVGIVNGGDGGEDLEPNEVEPSSAGLVPAVT